MQSLVGFRLCMQLWQQKMLSFLFVCQAFKWHPFPFLSFLPIFHSISYLPFLFVFLFILLTSIYSFSFMPPLFFLIFLLSSPFSLAFHIPVFTLLHASFPSTVSTLLHLLIHSFLSPHVMWRHIIYCMFLWVTAATKSTKFGSRYLGEGLLELDEILQVARGGLVYPTTQTGDLWPGGSPCRAKILKGVKIYCNAFLQSGFTDLDEIWHDVGL